MATIVAEISSYGELLQSSHCNLPNDLDEADYKEVSENLRENSGLQYFTSFKNLCQRKAADEVTGQADDL
ncbi:unnamed protein product [Dovyalis caffra]|uniref:Uncharacterized protein n=1 Tax=Dovyalis caffra TaxID=77055 RepID=A0AAV1RLW6_9ROSI|nr:unnamed protein product [Dovyalis caffra]